MGKAKVVNPRSDVKVTNSCPGFVWKLLGEGVGGAGIAGRGSMLGLGAAETEGFHTTLL